MGSVSAPDPRDAHFCASRIFFSTSAHGPITSFCSLIPGARNKHRGPRGGGVVTKDPKKKKKGYTKQSTQRRERLFAGTADGTGSTMKTCLPTERKDTRTDEEKAEVLAWVGPPLHLCLCLFPLLMDSFSQAKRYVARNPYRGRPESRRVTNATAYSPYRGRRASRDTTDATDAMAYNPYRRHRASCDATGATEVTDMTDAMDVTDATEATNVTAYTCWHGYVLPRSRSLPPLDGFSPQAKCHVARNPPIQGPTRATTNPCEP
jgi:hypothetical protein